VAALCLVSDDLCLSLVVVEVVVLYWGGARGLVSWCVQSHGKGRCEVVEVVANGYQATLKGEVEAKGFGWVGLG
jgi:hypothetical protein